MSRPDGECQGCGKPHVKLLVPGLCGVCYMHGAPMPVSRDGSDPVAKIHGRRVWKRSSNRRFTWSGYQ
jgi:hypothetical protein